MTALTARRVGTQPAPTGKTYVCQRCGIERVTRDDCPICDARRVGDRPAYFAGICWKRLRAMQEIAQQIVDGEG